MSIKIPRPVLFVLAYLFALALYWQSLNGTPIWDDTTYWFADVTMQSDFPYSVIWKNYAWPFSVSLQKFMLAAIGRTDFTLYHVFNLVLHFANSFLVYRLGRLLQFRYPFFYFLLFLLHPVAVITTAWMIQIKTLLCFFFALASLLAFVKGNKNRKWLIASWVLFALSIASKSSSFSLPAIFFLISYRYNRFSKIHLLVPFFLLSGWSVYSVLKSPVTQEGLKRAAEVTRIKATTSEEPSDDKKTKKIQKEEKQEAAASHEMVPVEVVTKPALAPSKSPVPALENSGGVFALDINLISQTMYYYFWQSFIPTDNVPVKGLNYKKAGITEIVHLVFLILMVIIFWKDPALYYLGSAYLMMVPFLGFIPAPFMSITWVSDQHLYLVLPALLAFWFRVLEKLKWKYALVFPSILAVYYSWGTYKATPQYKNQFVFYEKSLEYNPLNVPLIYNLAFAKLTTGDFYGALSILQTAFEMSKSEPIMQENIFYPYLVQFYLQMESSMEKNAN